MWKEWGETIITALMAMVIFAYGVGVGNSTNPNGTCHADIRTDSGTYALRGVRK